MLWRIDFFSFANYPSYWMVTAPALAVCCHASTLSRKFLNPCAMCQILSRVACVVPLFDLSRGSIQPSQRPGRRHPLRPLPPRPPAAATAPRDEMPLPGVPAASAILPLAEMPSPGVPASDDPPRVEMPLPGVPSAPAAPWAKMSPPPRPSAGRRVVPPSQGRQQSFPALQKLCSFVLLFRCFRPLLLLGLFCGCHLTSNSFVERVVFSTL